MSQTRGERAGGYLRRKPEVIGFVIAGAEPRSP